MLGTFLGNYRIIEKIGDGGMGTVFLAEQEEIGRRAAVKVLHQHFFDDPEIRERFFKEACAISQLSHPGIVELYDYGSDEQGLAFIVMEYLQGEDLSKRLRRVGGLPVSYAVHIARQVAEALGTAHRAGIIHRDLKPDNLFLVRAVGVEQVERIKILDFGVAKLLSHEHTNLRKTQTGTVIGTPPYMSPEQCRGNVPVDHRADLYSLGCILFRMMCGRTPFLSNGYGEMLAAHIHTPPPRPRDIEPAIPPVFEAIILKLLAKNPAERFQDAYELMAALDDGVANTHLGLPSASASGATSGPGRSGARRAASMATQSEGGDWVVELQSGMQAELPPPGTPRGTPMPMGGSTPMGTPAGIMLPENLPTTALSGSYPRLSAPWQQAAINGDGNPTTLQSAVIDLPRTPPPLGPSRRRLGLFALGALVCVVSAMVTLFALQVGPFSSGEKLAIADVSAPGSRSGQTTASTTRARPDDVETADVAGTGARRATPPPRGSEAPDTAAPDPEPARFVTEALPREAILIIESDPEGAEIYRRVDGVRIGLTPHEISVPAIDGELVILLKKAGYRDKEVAIPSNRSSTTSVDLERESNRARADRSSDERPSRRRPPRQKPGNREKPDSPPSQDDSPNPFK